MIFKIKALIVVFSLFVFFSIFTCKDVNKNDMEYPLNNLSYIYHIFPLLNAKCAYNGCHNSQDLAAGLNFTEPFVSMDQLDFTRPGWGPYRLVESGYPDNSMLFEVVRTDPSYIAVQPMPPLTSGIKPLEKKEREAIRKWIIEGADVHN